MYFNPKMDGNGNRLLCEDYGIFGEEDEDYSQRIRLTGKMLAYLEDEKVGIHLPAGNIERPKSGELITPKTEQDNKKQIAPNIFNFQSSGKVKSQKYNENLSYYSQGLKPLFVNSEFADDIIKSGIYQQPKLDTQNIAENVFNPSSPKLSIILPVSINFPYIKKCTEQIIIANPLEGEFELILVLNLEDELFRDFAEGVAKTNEKIKSVYIDNRFDLIKAYNTG